MYETNVHENNHRQTHEIHLMDVNNVIIYIMYENLVLPHLHTIFT